MASSYTTDLRIEKMVNGENSGTWGTKTNTNWDLVEQAIAGVASVAMTDAEYTLSTANAASDEARNAVITMTGTLTGTQNVIVPSVDKCYTIKNSTTGGYSIVVKTSAGTGVTIANGDTVMVYCDATNVLPAQTALGTTLSVSGGGTGRTTSTTAYGLIAAGTTATGAHQTLAAGATTEILVGGGASALPVWTTATGSGAPVRAASPTLVTPTLGVAAATSVSFGNEALSRYDEGTFTPSFSFASPGDLSFGYTTRIGRYVVVGKLVSFFIELQLSSFSFSTASGIAQISGLPFEPYTNGDYACWPCHFAGISKAGYVSITAYVTGVPPLIKLRACGMGVAHSLANETVKATDIPSGGVVRLVISGTYESV